MKRALGRQHLCTVDAPFGVICLHFEAERLTGCEFLRKGSRDAPPREKAECAAATQIMNYLSDPNTTLSYEFPSDAGTEFQRRVWKEVSRIPPGSTLTYGDIARRLRTSPRAVGNAMGANPLSIMIPCHRVVARGGLGGFMSDDSGWGMEVKKWLLNHESELPRFR